MYQDQVPPTPQAPRSWLPEFRLETLSGFVGSSEGGAEPDLTAYRAAQFPWGNASLLPQQTLKGSCSTRVCDLGAGCPDGNPL